MKFDGLSETLKRNKESAIVDIHFFMLKIYNITIELIPLVHCHWNVMLTFGPKNQP